MADTLAIRRVSATPGALIPMDALRSGGPTYAKLVDISKCIGCKGCEVACKEWNDLGIEPTANFGSYQSHQDLSPKTWLLMRFNEVEIDGNLNWADQEGRVSPLRGPRVSVRLSRPGCDRAVHERHRRLQSGELYRVPVLRQRLPVRHPAIRRQHPQGLEVQHVRGPGRSRARAGVREDLSDQRDLLGDPSATCWRWPTKRSRRSRRAATRTRRSTTRPASVART